MSQKIANRQLFSQVLPGWKWLEWSLLGCAVMAWSTAPSQAETLEAARVGVPFPVETTAGSPAAVKPTLVLLTSFEAPAAVPGLLGKLRPAASPQTLDAQFLRAWEGQGYVLKHVHHADRYALASALLDPSTVGVFWISQAPPAETLARRVEGSNIPVVDVHGHALESVLKQVHPNLRWLGLASYDCGILRDYLDEQEGRIQDEEDAIFPENSALTLHRLTLSEGPEAALSRLLERSRKRLRSPSIQGGYVSSCEAQSGYPLTIQRESGDGPWGAFSLTFRGKTVLTVPQVLDSSQAGFSRTVWVSAKLLKPITDWGVLVESGAPPNAQDVLPVSPLLFSSPAFPGVWRLRTKPDGSPLGRTQHVYDYIGEKRLEGGPTQYWPFACPPVAPAEVGGR